MNTTPLIFSPRPAEPVIPPYTIVGGTERAGGSGITALLLNRGPRYPRRQVFSALGKADFDYIISVENPAEHYGIDELAGMFPQVKFILLSEAANLGQRINIAVREMKTPLFFVLWNDLKILYGGTAEKIAERLLLPVSALARDEADKNWYRRLCTVPVFQNNQFEPLPVAISPVMKKNKLETVPYAAAREDAPSLYPYQGTGVYDRLRFLRIGGYDNLITNPHWQLMDFGFRAWLWGEEIRCTHHIRLRFDGQESVDTISDAEGYQRFYLKNLLPSLRAAGDHKEWYAHLPLKKLPVFLPKAGKKLSDGVRAFFAVRRWVHENRQNWKMSVDSLLHDWDIPA